MAAITLAAMLALTGCADPEAPAACTTFCGALGDQAARCGQGTAGAAAASCSAELDCAHAVYVRDQAALRVCEQELATACYGGLLPPECVGQFR